MARRRHHKAESLSPKATSIIEDGLVTGATYEDIAEKVKAAGEEISPAAIGRYHTAKFRPRQDAARSASLMAREMVEWMGDLSEPELRRAIELKTAQHLFPMLEELAKEATPHAAYFYASLEQRRIDEAKLVQRTAESELRAKQLEHQKQLAELRLKQIRQAIEAGEKKEGGRAPTKAELHQTLRDLYGIVREAEPEPAKTEAA